MTSVKGTVLVTGANGGLGSAIVEQLASNPKFASHYGIYTVRDMTRAAALTSSSAHEVMALDLTKLDNVRQVAEVINVSSRVHYAHSLENFQCIFSSCHCLYVHRYFQRMSRVSHRRC